MESDLDPAFETLTIEQAFWTPIAICSLPADVVDRSSLQDAITAQREKDRGLTRSNRGGWHSGTDMAAWGGPSFEALHRSVEKLANEMTLSRERPETATFPWKLSAWANVNENGSYNEQHCHPGAFWSAIFYVRVEPGAQGGELSFRDPRAPTNEMYAPKLAMRYNGGEGLIHLKPTSGMLILVPAWLQHSVRRWEGSEARISIALNLAVDRSAPAAID